MNRKFITGLSVALSLSVLVLFFVFTNPFFNVLSSSATPAPAQVISQDEINGTGATAQTGDVLTVDYTGKLENGTVFDSSVGKHPIQFVLGAGQVIPGWDQGLQGMKVGGKRLLVVPPDLAYGASGYGPIPGNSTLIFEVTLVALTPASPVQH